MNTIVNLFLNAILLFAAVSFIFGWYYSIIFLKYKKTEKEIYKRMLDINHTLSSEETKLYKESSDKSDYYNPRAVHAFLGVLILIITYYCLNYLFESKLFELIK